MVCGLMAVLEAVLPGRQGYGGRRVVDVRRWTLRGVWRVAYGVWWGLGVGIGLGRWASGV